MIEHPNHSAMPSEADATSTTTLSNSRRRQRLFRATKSSDWQDRHNDALNKSGRRNIQPSRSFDVAFLTRSQAPKDSYDGPFQAEMNHFQCSEQEVLSILQDDAAFRTLKASLRKRGCVTNGYLKENFHFYVQHVKTARERAARFKAAALANTEDESLTRNLQDMVRRKKMSAAA